jgi:hypothetical protein
VRTFEEGWTAAAEDATDCRLCLGTGYLQHGMVITEEDWVSTLIACSHAAEASETVSEEPTCDRTDVVGAHVRPEARPAVDRDGGPGTGGAG